MNSSEVKIEGFDTFRYENGDEQLVTRFKIERDDDYLGTGNYFVELFGEDDGGEFTIDAEEFINFKGVLTYLQYLGRDYEYMIGQLQKFSKFDNTTDEQH